MTVDEMNIRGIPGQEDFCLWLKKQRVEEVHNPCTGETQWIRWQRRCRLPQGHTGAHEIASFCAEITRRPWEKDNA